MSFIKTKNQILTILIFGLALMGFSCLAFPNNVEASYQITDDSTGGDCSNIGNWDDLSKTCMLNRDLNEGIMIEGSNITLDGNGHILTGEGLGVGIVATLADNFTLKNLKISNFEIGVAPSSSSGIILAQNEISFCNYGVHLRGLSNLIVQNNKVSQNKYGFIFSRGVSGDTGVIVKNNDIIENEIVLYSDVNPESYYYLGDFYNNNFIDNIFILNPYTNPTPLNISTTILNYPLPVGGNYWSDFDEEAEGCVDFDNDKICDSPKRFTQISYTDDSSEPIYSFHIEKDNLPWTTRNGWMLPGPYEFGGFEPPIKSDGTGVYKLGRTLPIKFSLTDSEGAPVETAFAELFIANINEEVVGIDEVPLSTSAADSGNIFRYDEESNHYVYNLDTSILYEGTWQIKAVMDDGNSYVEIISIK